MWSLSLCMCVCVMTLCACRPEDSFCCHFVGIVYFYLRKALSLAWSWLYQPARARESTYVCLPGTGIVREHHPSCAFTWVLREKNKKRTSCAYKTSIFWLSYLQRVAFVVLRHHKTIFFSLRYEYGVCELVLVFHPGSINFLIKLDYHR